MTVFLAGCWLGRVIPLKSSQAHVLVMMMQSVGVVSAKSSGRDEMCVEVHVLWEGTKRPACCLEAVCFTVTVDEVRNRGFY
jgi:hypothetical protein